jgi:hypothetical protein
MLEGLKRILSALMLLPLVLVVGCSSMVEVKIVTKAPTPAPPTAGPELPVAVAPTSTPVPPTPTPIPTGGVAATQTALAEQVAGLVAASLDQTATAEAAFSPTPTDTPITLTIYLRDTHTETGYAALSYDQRYGWMIYQEGQFVYGDAAVQIGDTVYHFDEPDELGQLPDPWRVEFEFAEGLVARTEGEPGFDAKKARFWVGTLGDASAVAADRPYSLTIQLYEGDELRESLQVFFTVADASGPGGEGGPGKSPPP